MVDGLPNLLLQISSLSFLFFFFFFLRFCLFIHERHRERQRQEKQAPCKEPDMGLDPRTLASCPELKADAQP